MWINYWLTIFLNYLLLPPLARLLLCLRVFNVCTCHECLAYLCIYLLPCALLLPPLGEVDIENIFSVELIENHVREIDSCAEWTDEQDQLDEQENPCLQIIK